MSSSSAMKPDRTATKNKLYAILRILCFQIYINVSTTCYGCVKFKGCAKSPLSVIRYSLIVGKGPGRVCERARKPLAVIRRRESLIWARAHWLVLCELLMVNSWITCVQEGDLPVIHSWHPGCRKIDGSDGDIIFTQGFI